MWQPIQLCYGYWLATLFLLCYGHLTDRLTSHNALGVISD